MRKRIRKMTACILTALLGLSIMNFPVHAQETQANQQVENSAVSIQNTESLFIGQSMFKTAIQALSATEPNNAGPFYVTGDTNGWTYDAVNKILTFTKVGNYKVTGDGNQTDVQIVVGANITITLTVENVNCHLIGAGMSIDGTANVTLMLQGENEFVANDESTAAIEFNDATTGSLTIKGTGSLKVHASGGAGIGSSEYHNAKKIRIEGGTINASSEQGAGIGGGLRSLGEDIVISGGTVTAESVMGAGIGGGWYSKAENITISGGTVTASSALGDGIGDSNAGSGSKDIKITGGSVKATGTVAISATPTDGVNPVYLAKLDIADNVNQIKVDGKDYQIEGKHENDTNYYLYMTSGEHYIETESNVYFAKWNSSNNAFDPVVIATNDGDLQVEGGTYGIDYMYDDVQNTLTFKKDGNYIVTSKKTGATTERIVVDAGLRMNLTVNNVKCHPTTGAGMSIDGSSTVTLMLQGENEFVAGSGDNAGIEFNDATDGSLTIDGTGSLTAMGRSGAGIGGGDQIDGNNITINGGIITASGDFQSAGIGGGGTDWGSANNITINGGTIKATGNLGGSGIGGGIGGTGRNITITGGNVSATGNYGGAGIGGGYSSYAENITISGGTVTATDNGSGKAGIGDGDSGSGSKNIKITGGSVKAIGKKEAISSTPTNGSDPVQLVTLPNQGGIKSVEVDGIDYKVSGNHPDGDTNFYLYLTGENHIITANKNKYKAAWDKDSSTFTITPLAPTPTNITTTQTASTITVTAPADAAIYGGVMYSKDNQTWQTSNIFENLDSSKDYIIYVKYKGNDTYIESEVAQKTVKTFPATYTITIPSTTLTAGNSGSKNEIKVSSMDIGYQDKVNVKILGNGNVSNNGMLTLTRQGASNTITSALLVNGIAFTDINNNIATFTKSNKDSVSISFAKPTDANIPAGTYNGTVTFEVTYTQ